MEKSFYKLCQIEQKSFIENNFSPGSDAKQTELACQSNYHEDDPSGIDDANGRAEDAAERGCFFLKKVACIFYQVTSI